MRIRAATDVGGTFTDLVFYEIHPATGQCTDVRTAKVDTTPGQFERGVMASLRRGEISPRDLAFFAHGATVVINAITERKGAKVGLITTRGFRDVLEIGRGNRPDQFNFNFRKPALFVERHLRAEVTERTNHRGEVEISTDLSELPGVIERFKKEGVEAVVVCFLHSYRNSANEELAAEQVSKLWPSVPVIASHTISREWREYERTSTAVLSAYVQPIVERYVSSLEAQLRQEGSTVPLYLMLSNGGIATPEMAKANPVAMVESGPSGGIYAAAYLGKQIGEPNLIVLDIGGTTAKCTLIEGDRKSVV